MKEQIRIIKEESGFEVTIGERTLDLLERLYVLSNEEKETLLKESSEILSNCINPVETVGGITGLALGYVQSGKTM